MKRKILALMLIIWTIIAIKSHAQQATYQISVEIPAIPGVNMPLIETSTTSAEHFALMQLNQEIDYKGEKIILETFVDD